MTRFHPVAKIAVEGPPAIDMGPCALAVEERGKMAANNAGVRAPGQVSVGASFGRFRGSALMAAPLAALAVTIPLAWGRGTGFLQMALFAGMYAATTLGIMLGYHRHFAHRGCRRPAAVRIAQAILGSMAVQWPRAHRVAVHRKHLAQTDRPDDPHSPHVYGARALRRFRGLWLAHLGWMFVQRPFQEAAFARDILGDRAVARVQRLYILWVYLRFALPAALGWALDGSWQDASFGLLKKRFLYAA
jgi:stearoyl-CoA desaturase (delta-9 desaturase)